MSRSKLQNALDEFVQTIVGIAEDTAQDVLTERVKALGTVRHAGRKPKARTPAEVKAKRRTMTKPCPVPECTAMGAPRHGMMCKEHSVISKAEKNALRFAAKQPGGKWDTSVTPKKATKRTKKRTKKAAKKKTAATA